MSQHNSDLAQNANSPEDEKPCWRAVLLDDKVWEELSKTKGRDKKKVMGLCLSVQIIVPLR